MLSGGRELDITCLIPLETTAARSLALVNPKSANAAGQQEWLRWFEKLGGAVEPMPTPETLFQSIAHRAASQLRTRLIVVGGDGSVSGVVNALGDALLRYEIAVIPTGTGNDFARSLGIPLDDPALAWEIALQGSATEVDLVALSGCKPRRFINTITAGFGGRQASDLAEDQKSSWGKIAYWTAAALQLGDMPEFDLRLKTPERIEFVRCVGFWLANGRYTGGGFPVAAEASLDDGLLDVVVVPSMPLLELLAAGVDLTLASPEQSERLLTFRAAELSVATAPEVPLSIDGEPAICDALECHVLPRALRIIAGNTEPA